MSQVPTLCYQTGPLGTLYASSLSCIQVKVTNVHLEPRNLPEFTTSVYILSAFWVLAWTILDFYSSTNIGTSKHFWTFPSSLGDKLYNGHTLFPLPTHATLPIIFSKTLFVSLKLDYHLSKTRKFSLSSRSFEGSHLHSLCSLEDPAPESGTQDLSVYHRPSFSLLCGLLVSWLPPAACLHTWHLFHQFEKWRPGRKCEISKALRERPKRDTRNRTICH